MELLDELRNYLRELDDERDQGWNAHWLDLRDYIAPGSGLFLSSKEEEVNRGEKRRSNIIDNTAGLGLRTLASGLHGGLTSPSRPWFKLGLEDEELLEYSPVKIWLSDVRDIMLRVFAKSNFYASVHALYEELGCFGTASMFIEEDFDSVIRCRPLTIGEYSLSLNSKYRPDTMFRRIRMTARQIVQAFGIENVSRSVKQAYETSGSRQKWFNVIHVIRPRDDRDIDSYSVRDMPYESIYFEEFGGEHEGLLRQSGYRGQPFIAPRWAVKGVDTYGRSPGMAALPDTRQLQRMQKDKLKGLAKMVDPPMKATGAMKPAGGNVVPGGITFVDGTGGIEGYTPAYQIDLRLAEIMNECDRVSYRIKETFFNDLFLSILNTDKTMTAREVVERHDEKMLMLGPTLERLHEEMLNPLVDRVFDICMSFGLFPPPPAELAGMELKTEYISTLAQAQKLVGLTGIEQVAGFVGNLVSVAPEALDSLNVEETIDEYANIVGVPPRIIRGKEEIAAIKAEREQQARMQAMLEQGGNIQSIAQGAKTLSETKVNGNPVLDNLLPGM